MPLQVLPRCLRAARRAAAARPEARRFVVRAWLGAPLVRASLALLGLRTTLRWVEAVPYGRTRTTPAVPMGNPVGVPQTPPVGVDEGRGLVGSAFRAHVVGGQCLDQSLVQYLLHRRDGLPVRLVLGVRRAEAPGIEAHAWVEASQDPSGCDGEPPFVPIFVGPG